MPDNTVAASVQYSMLYRTGRLLRHTSYWLLRERAKDLHIDRRAAAHRTPRLYRSLAAGGVLLVLVQLPANLAQHLHHAVGVFAVGHAHVQHHPRPAAGEVAHLGDLPVGAYQIETLVECGRDAHRVNHQIGTKAVACIEHLCDDVFLIGDPAGRRTETRASQFD